ncbi:hypothetical protein Vadar_009262 [Vaccinium darrowii]|uniref:Uncharacterized protein n=1 Tax=Vaccinium darrowii TaxID=229202 RepID=A0ACB7YME8_9ERIC|nr:hypothetical protein Vadar_009262 [Vaccinium darrowii]
MDVVLITFMGIEKSNYILQKLNQNLHGLSSWRSIRRVPTNRTRSVQAEPFINAISMEAMPAFGYAPQRFLGPVLGQAYWAGVVIGLRQTLALTQDYGGLWNSCIGQEVRYGIASPVVGLDPANNETQKPNTKK